MSESNPTAATAAVDEPASDGDKGPLSDDTFDNPDSKLARCNANEKRKERWQWHRFALSSLKGRTERWARQVVRNAEYRNATIRDPERFMPEVTFTGKDAVGAGATDAEIGALPRLSPDEIASLQIEAAALRLRSRQRIKARAESLATTRRPLTELIRLAKDMVSDPPAGIIVDRLLYEKTVTSWVGDGGTYKSFTVLGLACSVAAGRDFSGQLRVPQRYPVLYMCAEHRRHGLGGDIRVVPGEPRGRRQP